MCMRMRMHARTHAWCLVSRKLGGLSDHMHSRRGEGARVCLGSGIGLGLGLGLTRTRNRTRTRAVPYPYPNLNPNRYPNPNPNPSPNPTPTPTPTPNPNLKRVACCLQKDECCAACSRDASSPGGVNPGGVPSARGAKAEAAAEDRASRAIRAAAGEASGGRPCRPVAVGVILRELRFAGDGPGLG